MDPHQQQINQLDPRLKEAYEKVMGTGNPTPNVPTASPTPPAQVPTGAWVPPVEPGSSPPPIPAPPAPPKSIAFQPKPIGPTGTPVSSSTPSAHGFVAKKKTTVSPVIVVIGTIIFLAVYTLFWMKFFNIKIPFLP